MRGGSGLARRKARAVSNARLRKRRVSGGVLVRVE